ncbi:IS110 family transposase, partial [Chloroflexi bacterium TSY]|nr:IS110 family transposase [Chloroflexi bacterium TSY]
GCSQADGSGVVDESGGWSRCASDLGQRRSSWRVEVVAVVVWDHACGDGEYGVYWKPIYNVLHEHFEVWIVNARHLAQVPGRKTDESDAAWITKLMSYGLLERSFIPDVEQRDLRDLTLSDASLAREECGSQSPA